MRFPQLDNTAFEQWVLGLVPIGSEWADDEALMEPLVELSRRSITTDAEGNEVEAGGGPFAAALTLMTSDSRLKVLGVGRNEVGLLSDPSGHGEIDCFRRTGRALRPWDLSMGGELNLVMLTTGFPCLMCGGTICQCRGIKRVSYAATTADIERCTPFNEAWPPDLLAAPEQSGKLFGKIPLTGPFCNQAACAALSEFGRAAYTG